MIYTSRTALILVAAVMIKAKTILTEHVYHTKIVLVSKPKIKLKIKTQADEKAPTANVR